MGTETETEYQWHEKMSRILCECPQRQVKELSCDVVHVISINIDIDIATLASSLASQFFLRLCPNIRHWGQLGPRMYPIPTEGLLKHEGNVDDCRLLVRQ